MRERHNLTILLTVFVAVFSLGCVSSSKLLWNINKARDRLMELELGMSKQEVLQLMGKPYSREVFTGQNGEMFDFLLYITQYTYSGAIPDSDKTPICFRDGKLIGWGWNFYGQTKRHYEVKKVDYAADVSPKTAVPSPEIKKKKTTVPEREYPKPPVEPPPLPRHDVSQHWAVIIGVSGYQDTRIPALRYAAADAQAFYDWVVSSNGGKHAPSNVKLLMGRDATLASIKRALFNWLKQALEEDVVTIYFAGHGSPESPDYPNNLFLLSYDAKYDDIATTSFPMWDIETALKRFIKAKKVVVIADACHAGGVGQSFDIARRANRAIKVNPISSGLQSLSKIGDGVCVISASDDKQFSQEGKKWGEGHGVFTYFLLRGLKGEADYNRDNRVTLGELIPFLSEQVRRETRNAQCPTVAGKFDPALSIGR